MRYCDLLKNVVRNRTPLSEEITGNGPKLKYTKFYLGKKIFTVRVVEH